MISGERAEVALLAHKAAGLSALIETYPLPRGSVVRGIRRGTNGDEPFVMEMAKIDQDIEIYRYRDGVRLKIGNYGKSEQVPSLPMLDSLQLSHPRVGFHNDILTLEDPERGPRMDRVSVDLLFQFGNANEQARNVLGDDVPFKYVMTMNSAYWFSKSGEGKRGLFLSGGDPEPVPNKPGSISIKNWSETSMPRTNIGPGEIELLGVVLTEMERTLRLVRASS